MKLPDNLNWRLWIERWDRMQARHLVRREERIQLLVSLVGQMARPVQRVIDLGCGTGSLMQPFLDAFREAWINADHVASRDSGVQKYWERSREEMRRREAPAGSEDWEAFWEAYAGALGLSGQRRVAERVLGGWEGGVEEGLPLEWHFKQLKASGFAHPECFWRCDCDAINAARFQGVVHFESSLLHFRADMHTAAACRTYQSINFAKGAIMRGCGRLRAQWTRGARPHHSLPWRRVRAEGGPTPVLSARQMQIPD